MKENILPSVSSTAKNAASRLELLVRMKKLDIYHQNGYSFCGLFLQSHKFTIYGDRNRTVLFTAIQQLHRFGSSDYKTGSRVPLLIYHLSNEPILEMHFGSPQLFEFTPSSVAVTLPTEVLIGSLTKHDTTARTVLGVTTTGIKAFNVGGQFLYSAEDNGVTSTGETLHDVIMESKTVAKIRSGRDSSAITFIGTVPVDIRALLLATAIWLEIIERKRPRWRRPGNQRYK